MTATLHEQNDQLVADAEKYLHGSEALGIQKVIDEELAEVWNECTEPDWDGNGALPVTLNAYSNAYDFLLSLPLGTRPPSVGATPSGEITFEWHHSRRRTLTVQVTGESHLHYAALLGPDREFGSTMFFESVPQKVLSLINQVYAC